MSESVQCLGCLDAGSADCKLAGISGRARNGKHESRPLAKSAPGSEIASHRARQIPTDCETQASADVAARLPAIELDKRLEDLLHLFGRGGGAPTAGRG